MSNLGALSLVSALACFAYMVLVMRSHQLSSRTTLKYLVAWVGIFSLVAFLYDAFN